jgi:predicted transposase YdaD
LYSTLLEYRHQLPVRSVVVLLTKQAQLAVINGVYQRGFPGEAPYDTFGYQILKVWELQPERLLGGGLGTLPLAPICAVTEEQLPGIIEQMKARLDPARVPKAKDLWTSAYILMGLRYERELINRLLQGVVEMEESVTYQAIIEKGIEKGIAQGKEEGKREEARGMLLLLGEDQIGPASSEVTATIQGINDLERLHQLALRVGQVSSWEELLRSPSS